MSIAEYQGKLFALTEIIGELTEKQKILDDLYFNHAIDIIEREDKYILVHRHRPSKGIPNGKTEIVIKRIIIEDNDFPPYTIETDHPEIQCAVINEGPIRPDGASISYYTHPTSRIGRYLKQFDYVIREDHKYFINKIEELGIPLVLDNLT